MNRLNFIWKCNKGGRLKFRSDCSMNWGKWISKLLLSVWNACISLCYMFGSNETWWWVDLSTLINSNEENKRVIKGNVINCLCVMCWERVEGLLKACWIIVDVISCLCGCELCDVMKMFISSLFVWTSSALFWGIGCDKCYVHWESNGIGDGLTCPRWLILIMKRMGITKGNVINCLCVLCWERVEVLLNHCWCNFMFVWLWTVRCYENGHLHYLCELVICVILRHCLW